MSEPQALSRARPDDFASVRLHQKVAVIANEACTFAEAIQAALDEVCAYTGWPVGHAYLPDPDSSGSLTSTNLWHLDDPERFQVFREVTEAIPLRAGVGLPGRVLVSRRPEWICDVVADSNFPRAHVGRDIVVRGAFGVPVMTVREVVAVLEFFTDRPRPIDKELLELMGYVGTQLGRVAERERAERRLREQVEHNDHLIESAYDAFVAIDEVGRIINWNHAAEQMFGWPRDEVIGLPLAATIVPPSYRDRHLSGVARYLATGEEHVLNQRLELSAVRRTGEEFPIELAIWPVGEDSGRTFCAFIHDITGRKRAELELREADEASRLDAKRMLGAQEMALLGSWEWDVETNEIRWSEQLYRNFGVSPETFTPTLESYMSLVHPDDKEMVAETISKAISQPGWFELEHRSRLPADGSVRVHHCTGHNIVVDGRTVRMAGTNQDVTERRTAEEAVKEAYEREREMVQRLRELDDAKTKFVSSVSHELRTPLTSIIGYHELLLVKAEDMLTPECKEMLDVIGRNTERLLGLIEDLLTQSRIESGSFKLELQETKIGPIVVSAVESMLPSAVEADVALDVKISHYIDTVMGDADQLERLLLNLLTNAIKFTPDGSVTVEARANGGNVEIIVTDTGIGIPEEELPRLFSPFFRSSNADRAAPGTGLGLVIVKAIVDAHRGSIDVRSKPGLGTAITVKLPAHAEGRSGTAA